MKFTSAILSLLVSRGHGFLSTSPTSVRSTGVSMVRSFGKSKSSSILNSSPLSDNDEEMAERMREIIKEESMNPATMAASAEQMKSMKPEDMDRLIQEMDGMDPLQASQLKAMGMDPDLMKKSMKMMKENPQMMEQAQKMMSSMSPEQLAEQSRLAQEQMSKMTPEQVEVAAKAMNDLSPEQVDAAAEMLKMDVNAATTSSSTPEVVDAVVEEKPAEPVAFEGSSQDPKVIDAMFSTAEFMSTPPTGGVTFKAFATLPPVTVLSGTSEEDLSPRELKECWEDGSLGSSRVDRAGFERVWNEIQEYFEDDVMEASRKTIIKRKGAAAAPTSSTTPQVSTTTPPPPSASADPVVGANLTPEQIAATNDRVKSMSEGDFGDMLDQMNDMTPEQEARMKAMGVNTEMMKKASTMMANNPMMRKAAQTMMKNMSPEQMMKASQQAQQQMKNMSNEDYEKAFKDMEKGQK